MATAAEEQRAVLLRGDDNVAVAARPIPQGVRPRRSAAGRSRSASRSRWGTRWRCADIAPGEPVRKYGQIIGFASQADPRRVVGPRPQRQGRPVRARLRLRHRAARRPAARPSRGRSRATSRPDGRVGTRNYIAVISTVNCSASTSQVHRRAVPATAPGEATSRTSTASSRSPTRGAAAMPFDGPDHQQLDRVAGRVRPAPNVGGLRPRRPRAARSARRQHLVEAQDLVTLGAARRNGGARRAGRPGAEHPGVRRDPQDGRGRRSRAVAELLPEANDVDADRAAGLEASAWRTDCGGSDGNSGVTANPALGVAADLIVAQGGTADPRRDDRDLRRRAPAHPPGRQPRGRREAGRADQVVGVVHRHLRRRDQQQPVAGQQGGRPDDDLREVARGARQGRHARALVDVVGYAEPVDSARASSSWTRPATTRRA